MQLAARSLQLIALVLILGCVVAINMNRSLRKKSFTFAKKGADVGDLKGFKLDKYGPLFSGASSKDVAQIDGKHALKPKENMIIIDAGGSGTRLYLFEKDVEHALVLKSNIKATDVKQRAALTSWIKSARGLNKGKTIGLATAGMRLEGAPGDMQKIICDGESDKAKCLGRTMPGALEGALGFTDGTYSVGGKFDADAKGCYIEFGSTSSQFAVESKGKIWALSGVRSGLNPVDGSVTALTSCDASGKTTDKDNGGHPFLDNCEKDVLASPIFDKKLKECLELGNKVISTRKCDKLLIRVNPFVINRIVGGMQTLADCMETTADNNFSQFNCAAALGMKNIVKGLGLKDLISSKTMVKIVGEEVEWAWGLYKYFSRNTVDLSKFAGEDQGKVSDCNSIDIPSAYSF